MDLLHEFVCMLSFLHLSAYLVSRIIVVGHCCQMNNRAYSLVDCFHIDSCANDNIHKDFRKAIGANCIFYSAQTHELIVLVSPQNTYSNWVS